MFQVFPCTAQIALFWQKLLPALFIKKPRYPCPFQILAEALNEVTNDIVNDVTHKYVGSSLPKPINGLSEPDIIPVSVALSD
jgi:hypothetical protein